MGLSSSKRLSLDMSMAEKEVLRSERQGRLVWRAPPPLEEELGLGESEVSMVVAD